jgi:hypothetical protein
MRLWQLTWVLRASSVELTSRAYPSDARVSTPEIDDTDAVASLIVSTDTVHDVDTSTVPRVDSAAEATSVGADDIDTSAAASAAVQHKSWAFSTPVWSADPALCCSGSAPGCSAILVSVAVVVAVALGSKPSTRSASEWAIANANCVLRAPV